MRHPGVDARAWTIAQELRGRRGWLLEQALVERSWSVRLGAAVFEVSAYVLFLFDCPSMVVQLASTAPEGLDHLRDALGERYRAAPTGDRLFSAVRTDQPKQHLAAIARLDQVLGRRAARRFGPSPRSKDGRRWHVVEALRASSWRPTSLGFGRTIGDERRRVHASIGVVVENDRRQPGLAMSFGGWIPRTTQRWTRFCANAVAGFTAEGFRVNAQEPGFFHVGRWGEGLSSARTSNQAAELDRWIETGAAVID